MMSSTVPSKRSSYGLPVTAESNDSSPVPSSPPSTGTISNLSMNLLNFEFESFELIKCNTLCSICVRVYAVGSSTQVVNLLKASERTIQAIK